ncbi:hypothetical protein EYF80_011051 [Liparis tanakae]|uniref:Uncharacterized protein n=1 Tax=Liparis tanakae TaxID=230148 RepID=A0A4Z2ILK5_9TELE|nr:hypothetical protein EYF80_011051 [Liparis tanakae]
MENKREGKDGETDTHVTHLAPQHGLHSYTGDEVEPDDVQHLEDQQQEVEEPPGRVRPHDGPALKQSGVQDPGRPRDKTDVKVVTAGRHACYSPAQARHEATRGSSSLGCQRQPIRRVTIGS